MRRLAVLLALSACVTPGVVIPDDGSVTDPDLDPDTEPDTEPDPVSEFAGAWEATLVLGANFGRGPSELCIAELELVVDDEGGLSSEGFCQVTFGGGRGRSGYEVTVDGSIDDDGVVEANSTWVAQGRGIAPIDDVELQGETTDTTGQATGATTIDLGFPLDAEVALSLSR